MTRIRSPYVLGLLTGSILAGAGVYMAGGFDAESAVARRVGVVEPERGEGKIVASVVDPRGAPVPGVRVTIRRRLTRDEIPPYSPNLAPDMTLDAELRRFVDRRRSELARTRRETTDAGGRAVFDRLPSGEYEGFGAADGFLVEREESTPVRTGDSVVLTARRLGRVPVKIHVPPGYDPSAVMLYRVTTPPDKRRHSRQGVGVRWKRGHEVVELPEGEQTLYANFDSLRPGSVRDVQSEERTIVVKGGETAAPVEFRFAARTAIHVDVKSESGEGAFQAVVYCMENPRGREPDLTLLKSLGKSTTMGHDFRFLELKPGTYLLGVAAGWSAPIESTRFVDLTEGELERVEFSLRAAPASGDAFLLRVRSAGSMPLAHPRLSLEIEGSAPAPLELTAERDGYAFKLSEDRRELLRRRDPAPPAATLTIEAAYHATVKIPFDVRKRELDVELPKAVTLTIRLSGYRGSGREGLLSILVKQQGSNGSGVHRVDADGTAVVPYLTPGTYELRVSMATPNPADPYASEILTAQQIEVPAEGGEVTLTLAGSAGAK